MDRRSAVVDIPPTQMLELLGTKSGGVFVVAAHPDDETIGCGGLLGRVPHARIVHLTDGVPSDGSLRPSAFRDDDVAYRQTRAAEVLSALAIAGVDAERVIRLGAVDQESSYSMVLLVDRLLGIFMRTRPGVVITHPYEGGHPDHDTAAFVVRAASTLLQRRHGFAPEIWEMTSYHAEGDRLVTGTFLEEAPTEKFILVLAPDERRRKKLMMCCFATQAAVLASFRDETEHFRRAPRYDFSLPPHPGALYYEQLGWPLTGRRWRELALDAERRLLGSS
jgi:LmbE family N-acetylglucosaminyl deacetylase